jgi:hypothetical protein
MEARMHELITIIRTAYPGSGDMLDAVDELYDIDPAAVDDVLAWRETEVAKRPRQTTEVDWLGPRGTENTFDD